MQLGDGMIRRLADRMLIGTNDESLVLDRHGSALPSAAWRLWFRQMKLILFIETHDTITADF
jgi:hypothetical protein